MINEANDHPRHAIDDPPAQSKPERPLVSDFVAEIRISKQEIRNGAAEKDRATPEGWDHQLRLYHIGHAYARDVPTNNYISFESGVMRQ